MELQQLRYFLVSAEKGSLTRAAEELYTSQPHVSQVIKSLERELGVTLFRRTGTGIALTAEGERALVYAQNALKNVSLLEEACSSAGRSSCASRQIPAAAWPILLESIFWAGWTAGRGCSTQSAASRR